MGHKLWLLQVPIVLLLTGCFLITEMGSEGALPAGFLHDTIFPPLRSVSGFFTNEKFKIRGPQAPKNKVVIVEIDSPALDEIGRWPWHRDVTAKLIEKIFAAGAKVVGLDMVFSEPDRRVPPEMGEILKGQNMANLVDLFETDPALRATIKQHAGQLVLGWETESLCLPKYFSREDCPVTLPEAIATLPPNFERFALEQFLPTGVFNPERTPIASAPTVIANIDAFSSVAEHAGSFNANPDHDGYIRRTSLITFVNGKPHPSLPLEMARAGLGEKIRLETDSKGKVSRLLWANSGKRIRANPSGIMEINFRGPGRTFSYVPALDLLANSSDKLQDSVNRKLAGVSKSEILKDAYVLIGLTATGVYDMRAFPFDSNVAGVEGHATILDNLLSGDALFSATTGKGAGLYITLFLMTVGALGFAYALQRLEAVQALLLFIAFFGAIGVVDTQILFRENINWDTGFFGIELFSIFVFTLAAKYMIEERNKKFIKSAFAKYVAPSIVDSILKDPTKLSLGGEKRDLTILFSDIRGFTNFSENMDAKSLAGFLNDYLGIMTKIVFAHEGTLDKYIGDAVMAFWGAPLDQPKHAYNCSMAAIAMIKALEENRERFRTRYGVEVNIGIGVNSGIVNVGNMGSDTNFEYTVIGDHVNLASRLEGLTKTYGVGIVTTRFTLDHIAEQGIPLPPHRVLDQVKVKGKKNAVELIQLSETAFTEIGLKLFEQARELYARQSWDAAIEKFGEANHALGGHDGPCAVFSERCKDFKASPPAPDWDGAWEMHSK